MRNGRGLVFRVGVKSRSALCMNQNVWGEYSSGPKAHQHRHVRTFSRALEDKTLEGIALRRAGNEQVASVSSSPITLTISGASRTRPPGTAWP